ncbi:MAG: DoxX family membrane protein [Desulfarculus sp.]|nr:DoxX family membrane protein [Desulfarculus sp.]
MSAILELISLLARLITAGVFLFAAYDKVWDPANFAASMATYDLLPLWAINAASVSLAWLEMLVGTLLLIGLLTRAAALWACSLLVFFIGLMIYAGITGAGFETAIRDIIFLIPAAFTALRPGRWLSLGGERG